MVATLYTPHYNSMMKEHSIDETTIKKIVGHSGAMTLTERVYTHLDVRVLIDAINKIAGERENGKEENKQKKQILIMQQLLLISAFLIFIYSL